MYESKSPYSVPDEATKLLQQEIVNDPRLPELPPQFRSASKLVHFQGQNVPSIPVNWRLAESVAALKGFEASLVNVLRQDKYGAEMCHVDIDTDHASLFIMSPFLLGYVDGGDREHKVNVFQAKWTERFGFREAALHRPYGSLYRTLATNIYKTKDDRWYQLHGSMNPDPTLAVLDMPFENDKTNTWDEVVSIYQKSVARHEPEDLDRLLNDHSKQSGSVCWSQDEYASSEQGKATENVSLYEVHKAEDYAHAAAWWPEQASMPSSAERPLAGLKVVDLTRIIAGPTTTRALAELGASVMRVTSSSVSDMASFHPDLNWGKWNCDLDLKNQPEDRAKLADLIGDADVVVDAYRPGVMARHGFDREDIFGLVKDRARGIIHVRQNCYGWHGPWQHRSGWQQISDACCGISLEYGKAMGLDEAVVPVFPNSDYCAGIAGSIGTLHALIRRGKEGGSYGVDSALNYYSRWLTRSVGTYPPDVWKAVWQQHGSPVFRHHQSMAYSLPTVMALLEKNVRHQLFKPEFFERRESKAVGHNFVTIKPIARWEDGKVRLGYNVGTRSNGTDSAKWPHDLSDEFVS